MVEPYQAFCVQPDIKFSTQSNPSPVKDNLGRCMELLEHITSFRFFTLSYPSKIIAFPEWFLQGSHYKDKEGFFKICLTIPGEETDRLGEVAKKNNLYICGHALEIDSNWKSRFFSTGFIIGPSGKVELKYRKISTTNMNLTLATSPHDVLDDYKENIFPVLKTEIGNLACFISYDRHFPEIPRSFALNGAEVFVMPSVAMEPWMSKPNDWWTVINRARAQENIAYLVAPNAAWLQDSSHPRSYAVGHSQIVDYNGVVISEASSPNETIICATIDIDRLRKRREKAPWNFLAELRTELFRETYSKTIYPPNIWIKNEPKSYAEIDKAHKAARENFKRVSGGSSGKKSSTKKK